MELGFRAIFASSPNVPHPHLGEWTKILFVVQKTEALTSVTVPSLDVDIGKSIHSSPLSLILSLSLNFNLAIQRN